MLPQEQLVINVMSFYFIGCEKSQCSVVELFDTGFRSSSPPP